VRNDVEELLRDGMRRATDGVRMAPDLAGRMAGQAAGRRRRRRLRTRAGVAGGAAAAVAVGVFAMGAGPAGGTAPPGGSAATQAHTAAYVLGHVNQALATVASRPSVAQIRWSIPGAGQSRTLTTGWLYESPKRLIMVRSFPGAGIEVRAASQSAWPVTGIALTIINYRTSTWFRRTVHFPGGTLPAPSCQRPWAGSIYVSAAALRHLVGCGDYAVAGRQQVDGEQTLKLVLVKVRGMKVKPFETVWVNASTYLPVRFVIGPTAALGRQIDLRWLPATTGNLAHLTLHVPGGFKQVSRAQFLP
jgi:hypothetical protein